MNNVTSVVLEAIPSKYIWMNTNLLEVIEELKKLNYIVDYWDKEENWATIISDNSIQGYLCVKYPILFICGSQQYKIEKLLDDFKILKLILVSNLENELIELDYYNINAELFSNIPTNILTVEDIWFYTNSI